jgi:hypothetical protein
MSTVAARRRAFCLADEASDLRGVWVPEAGMLGASLTHRGEELDFDRRELLAAFPFPHRIEMEIAIVGSTLTVAAALLPTADEPVPVASASNR